MVHHQTCGCFCTWYESLQSLYRGKVMYNAKRRTKLTEQKRSEIYAKFRHREKFRAGKFKRARTSNDGEDITPPKYRSRDHQRI